MSIRSLGYLKWNTPDADKWRSFGTDILGMMPVDGPEPDSLYFRTDDRPFRLIVTPSETKQVTLGFEVVDDIDLEGVARTLEDAGTKVVMGSDDEAAARRVTGLLRFDDPAGVPVEVFHGPILDHVRVQTPLVSAFLTGDMGMGHVVIGTDPHKAVPTADFYRRVLGFRRRNTMRVNMGDHTMNMEFLGCNPRHHTLGVVGMPWPGGLTHFMLEAQSLDDVGYALDRVNDAKIPLAMSLGRHTNDHMVSFYCMTPDGAMVEFGWGGLQLHDADEPETTYEITKPSFWGHRPPAR